MKGQGRLTRQDEWEDINRIFVGGVWRVHEGMFACTRLDVQKIVVTKDEIEVFINEEDGSSNRLGFRFSECCHHEHPEEWRVGK